MLLRDLWSQKLDWDDIVSKEFQNLWSALSCDLAKLDSLQFPRFVKTASPIFIYFAMPVKGLTVFQFIACKIASPT